MRKVNNYEIISLLMFINITMYLGININIIKTTTGVNAWLTVLISNIIGFIPLILFLYASIRYDIGFIFTIHCSSAGTADEAYTIGVA